MDQFGSSIISIVAAALVVGVTRSICQEKSSIGALIRMICGLFLAFHLIQPFVHLDFDVINTFSEEYNNAGDVAAARGKALADDAACAFIKAETEAYILDKAAEYGAEIDVDVTVCTGDIPKPDTVRIRGSVAPYARTRLRLMIESDLGIAEEKQIWIG